MMDKLTELELNLARSIDALKEFAKENDQDLSVDVKYDIDFTRKAVYELVAQIEFFKEHGISKEEAEWIKGGSI